jgi:hypothetical protein
VFANEMRKANLQLSVELMMGLPGATLESFCEDLQQCIDREIPARINHTTMLVNSPMNSPDYRAEHQIETGTELGPGKMPVLVSTRTYTRDDMDLMLEIRQVFNLLDNFGVLRLCSRFVRQLVTWGPYMMAPVYSWALVLQELREFLVTECGVPDDSSLDAILKAQHALLPAHGREFPCVVELAHDVADWHGQMLSAKAAGHWRDWHLIVPPLSEFPVAQLQVNDEGGWVTSMMGCDIELASSGVNWDMDSAIGRARVDQDFAPAYIQEEEATQIG